MLYRLQIDEPTFNAMLSVSPVDPDDFASVRNAPRSPTSPPTGSKPSEDVGRANAREDVVERTERATDSR